jgi:hypothetical protein
MNLDQTLSPPCRLLATVFVFATALFLRAEQIQFSKPAVAIAAPDKNADKLPQRRDDELDFGWPGFDQPVLPQPPQIVRIRPRESKENDRDNDRSKLRDPLALIDPSERYLRQSGERRESRNGRNGRESGEFPQNNARNPFGPPRTAPNPARLGEMPGLKRDDDARALSPVTDFNWTARDSEKRASNLLFGNRSTDTERNAERSRNPFGAREEAEQQNHTFGGRSIFNVFTAHQAEKPTREVLEQRALFEHLMNPDSPKSALAVKSPGSFEPVPSFDAPGPAVPLKMPTIGEAKIGAQPGNVTQPFGVQQAQLRPPTFDSIGKRNPAQIAPKSASVLDVYRPTPLNRQPTVHELPSRKF